MIFFQAEKYQRLFTGKKGEFRNDMEEEEGTFYVWNEAAYGEKPPELNSDEAEIKSVYHDEPHDYDRHHLLRIESEQEDL
jgi:hypothetical protein